MNTNPYLIIMQGVPGSGKSTAAEQLADRFNGIICSTDDFFHTDDGYKFDPSKLGEYNKLNLEDAVRYMNKGRGVIIDNTNLRRWECREYVRQAVKLGFNILFVRTTGRFLSTHGVPPEKIESMRACMEDLTIESVLNSTNPWEKRKTEPCVSSPSP